MFQLVVAGLVNGKMILKPPAAELEHQKRHIKAPAAAFATEITVLDIADADVGSGF
jgi:hypothetical protein